MKLKYKVIVQREKQPAAGYHAYCPKLPGCVSNGGSPEEAVKNLREAAGLYIESLRANGQEIPPTDLDEPR